MRKLWTVLVVLAMAGLGAGMGVSLAQIRDTSSNLDRAWTEIDALRGTVDVANERLAAQGEKPVTVPQVTTEAPGVVTVVRGADGDKGDKGDTGDVGPVSTTLGPMGGQGIPGLTVVGDKGDKGDDGESIKGDDGADSIVPGPAGRGIASGPACQDDGSWLVTYDDGTTFTSAGPCRVIPAAEPDPVPVTP